MKYQKIKKEMIDAVKIQKETINDALVFTGGVPLDAEELNTFTSELESKGLYIQTLEGTKKASIHDYIIKTEEGYNVVNGPLFDSLYEKVME